MAIEEDDWRLSAQHDYLKQAVLVRKNWVQTQDHWDHDHCSFCWQKISENARHADSISDGYTTADDYHWICPTCFEDFKELFGFTTRQ